MGKELVTKFVLKNKEFYNQLSATEKQILKVSVASGTLTAATVAIAKHTANFQDQQIKAARSVGASVKSYSALAVAAEYSGASQEQLGMAMRKLAHPTGEAQKALDAYGIKTKDANGKVRDTAETLKDVSAQMNKFSSNAEKTAFATRLFGESGGKLVSMLEGGPVALDAFSEKALLMGKIVTEEAGLAAEKFNDDIADVTGSINGLSMSIGESIIAFTNQSNILNVAEGAIQSVTKFIREMDADTKETIITIGAVVVGLGTLGGAVMAAAAVAPYIGAAFTTAFGPIGLAVAGATALIVVFGTTISKYSDQMGSTLDQLGGSFDGLKDSLDPIVTAAGKVADAASDFLGIGDNATESAGEVAIMGTVVKVTMSAIVTAIDFVITGFSLIITTVQGVVVAIYKLGEAAAYAITGNFKEAKQSAKESGEAIIDMAGKIADKSVAFAQRTAAAFSKENMIVVKTGDIEEAKKQTEGLNAELDRVEEQRKTDIKSNVDPLIKAYDDLKKAIDKASSSTGDIIIATAKVVDEALKKVKILTDAWEQYEKNKIENARRSHEKMMLQYEVFTQKYLAHQQEIIDETRQINEDNYNELERSLTAEVDLIRSIEDKKLDALKNAKNERLLLLDEEYQEEKARREAEFQNYLASERVRFEQQNAQLDEFNLVKAEKKAIEIEQEASWNEYVKMLQEQHEQDMSDMTSQYADNRKIKGDEINAEMEAAKTVSDINIKSAEAAKNKALEDEKKRSDEQIVGMEKKKADEEKKIRKGQAFMQWQFKSYELEALKNVQIAQTTVAGFAGAAQALAAFSALGPVGIAAGATASAMILKNTANAVRMIATQTALPPAELFLATGGSLKDRMGGFGAGSGDIVPANISLGETVLTPGQTSQIIDTQRTRAVQEFIDDGSGGRGVSVIFEEGAIPVYGNLDERAVEQIGTIVAARLDRR